MNVIITGEVGIGKSTVCRRIVDMAREDGFICGGVLTSKDKDNLLVENIETGERELLASGNHEEGAVPVGRYSFNLKGIQFGQRAIQQSLDVDLLAVDECGPLELRGAGFSDIFDILHQRGSKINLLVIRKKLLEKFKKRFNLEFNVFEVTRQNRGTCHKKIYTILKTPDQEQFF